MRRFPRDLLGKLSPQRSLQQESASRRGGGARGACDWEPASGCRVKAVFELPVHQGSGGKPFRRPRLYRE